MRDVYERRAEVCLQLLQLDLHVLAEFEIERAQRLVEQEQRGFEHETPRDRDALLLATRQLIDPLAFRTRQADSLEHRCHALANQRLGGATAREPVADVFADRHHREQRKMLEYHVDRPAIGQNAPHRASAYAHVTGVRLEKSRDKPEQRRLAAARGSENRKEAAAPHRERQVVDREVRAVTLADPIDFEVEVRHRHFEWS